MEDDDDGNKKSNKKGVIDTSLNWTHVALFISTVFTIGVGYTKLNDKMDEVLKFVAKYETLELRITHMEQESQAQQYINKDYDERFDRDEDKTNQEQKPIQKHNTQWPK